MKQRILIEAIFHAKKMKIHPIQKTHVAEQYHACVHAVKFSEKSVYDL